MNFSEYKQFQSEFLDLLDQLERQAEACEFSALVESCRKLKERVIEERFFVAVLGEIKRGKSTLINAILGADILPKASTICTAALCIIKFGEKPQAILFDRRGNKVEISVSDLNRIVTRKNKEVRDIGHVEIEFPLPLLRDGVVIVDTPGVNDTDEVRRRITEEFIPRSDGVLFVLNAGQPLSHSELQFLSNGVLKYNLRKIWFVINGIDRLETEAQKAEAVEFCRNHLWEILPDAKVFPLSAKAALQGIIENDPQKLQNSKLPEFFENFSEELVEDKRSSLFDVPLGIAAGICDDVQRGISWSQSLLGDDLKKFQEQCEKIESEIGASRRELERIQNRFFAGVEALVYETANSMKTGSSDDLTASVRRILKTDEPDEQKAAHLAALASAQIQCFSESFNDSLYKKVSALIEKTDQEILNLISKLDLQTVFSEKSAGIKPSSVSLPPVKPGLGIEGRTFISSFGRLSTMVFLLQGNLLFAAASLFASFAAKLGEGDVDWVASRLGEQIEEAKKKTLDHFIGERKTFAEAYLAGFGGQLERILAMLEEILEKNRQASLETRQWLEERRKKLFESLSSLALIRKKNEDLARRVRKK